MFLWVQWWLHIQQLRHAFTRKRTFLWFVLCIAGITVRVDMAGVSSIVRSLGLQGCLYDRLLDCFHSSAIRLDRLTVLWVGLIRRCCAHFLLSVNGRLVILGDGIKYRKPAGKCPVLKNCTSNRRPTPNRHIYSAIHVRPLQSLPDSWKRIFLFRSPAVYMKGLFFPTETNGRFLIR